MSNSFYEVGKSYYIVTRNYAVCGAVTRMAEDKVVLYPAAYVPATGRFTDAMRGGFESTNSEIVPTNRSLLVTRDAVLEAYEYDHPIPTKQV